MKSEKDMKTSKPNFFINYKDLFLTQETEQSNEKDEKKDKEKDKDK